MTQATAPQPTVETLPISQIRRDGGTQPRSHLNQEIVNEYGEDMRNGKIFPPVVVFYDGQEYWLADGFHRIKAAEVAGFESIGVDLRHGSRREAVLYSVGANAIHGLRRTPADRRRAVVRLLSDPEWSRWSNVEIARQCAVSERFVRNVKGELSSSSPKIDPAYSDQRFGVDQETVQEARQLLEEQPAERYAQRGGTTYTIQTSNIGKGTVTTREETTSSNTEVNNEAEASSSRAFETVIPQPTPRTTPEVLVLPRQEPLSAPIIPGRRQRAKEPIKPEIVSVQPKEKSFIIKPRQVETGSLWRLGKSHLLYCGNPDDAQFRKLLPQKIELLIRVTSSSDGLTQSVPSGTVSVLALITPYGGERDLRLFREWVQNGVDLYTDPGDAIVLAYLPDPSVLLLMDELESRCFCAEPDPKRCEEALTAWTVTGKQVERG
ncbi:MAG TPA: ParB N-terminal domain-containing protein [Candidatus Caenarcaniphilales bacterium]